MIDLQYNIIILVLFFIIFFICWRLIIFKKDKLKDKLSNNSKIEIEEIKAIGNGTRIILLKIEGKSFIAIENKGSTSSIIEV